MSKFHPVWKVRRCRHFPSKTVTSPNCLTFHMHVSSGDSNEFCKFHEFWRTLRKCQNFILFWRSSAVGIFPSKIVTSLNCLKFHMHVSGGDSNNFCNFHDFGEHWKNIKILSFLEGRHFPSKIVTSPICLKFHMLVSSGDSNNFCKFHEILKNIEKMSKFHPVF